MVGVNPSCALSGGFTIDARVSLLWQHTRQNAKCQRLRLYLLYHGWLILAITLSRRRLNDYMHVISQTADITVNNKQAGCKRERIIRCVRSTTVAVVSLTDVEYRNGKR